MNATEAAVAAPVARRRGRSRFYVGMALLMIAIALTGFWPRYYGQLLSPAGLDSRSSHLLIHLHSTLFMGWLVMLLAQALLVRSGRTAAHRLAGPILAAYGYVAAAVGIYAGIVLAARRVELGQTVDQAAAFVFITITDMLFFIGFLTAAMIWRRRPEAHKRLILLATWSLAIVGFNRILRRLPGDMETALWLRLMLLPLPAWIGIAHDWVVRRRIHPVWWIGLAAFMAWAGRRFYAETEAWLPFGRAIVGPYL